jgi:alpha-L-arabinofuranosidase
MPTQYLEPLLAGMHARLQHTVPNGQSTAIAFDEWNTMWERPGSVAMALYVGGVLNMLCRDATALGIVQANYFMPINEGAIRVSPLDAKLDTAGDVFRLYKVHQGNYVLHTPAVTEQAALDLCMSASPDGKSLYATVINRDVATAQSLEITLKNAAKASNVESTSLTPRTLDMNEREMQTCDERLSVQDGNRIVLTVPAAAIVRVHWRLAE